MPFAAGTVPHPWIERHSRLLPNKYSLVWLQQLNCTSLACHLNHSVACSTMLRIIQIRPGKTRYLGEVFECTCDRPTSVKRQQHAWVKIRPKAARSGIFGRFPNFDKCNFNFDSHIHQLLHGHPCRHSQKPHRIRRHQLLPIGIYRS